MEYNANKKQTNSSKIRTLIDAEWVELNKLRPENELFKLKTNLELGWFTS